MTVYSIDYDPQGDPNGSRAAMAARRDRVAKRIRTDLDAAADGMPQRLVRDVVCDWLVAKGLRGWDGSGARPDRAAMDRAARIAHADVPGHVGPLDLCHSDLCRALSEAGAR